MKYDLKAQVIEHARNSDIDLIGFAPVERFENAPEGRRPADLLDGAKTVISLGIGIPQGVGGANQKAYGGLRSAIYIYMIHGYNVLNTLLNHAAFRVAKFLEKHDHIGLPIPASPPAAYQRLEGVFSNRHAAVATGLGTFGWQSLLLTPEFGPRLRVVSVITTAEIPVDPLIEEELCPGEACMVCARVCPVEAIPEQSGVSLQIGNKEYRYAKIDKWRCRTAEQGLTKATLGLTEFEGISDVNAQTYLGQVKAENPWQKMERQGPYCGRCIIECPVGKRQ
jgi:epoxyqueuosine reductase QueG